MPKFIVETNFFIEAEDSDVAESEVKAFLEGAMVLLKKHEPLILCPRFTVAWVEEDWTTEEAIFAAVAEARAHAAAAVAHCPCGDPADCSEAHA